MKINNVELTPEMIERLRDYAPIKIENTFLYVPVAYRKMIQKDGNPNPEYAFPRDVWPVFTLSYVDGREIVKAEDMMNGSVSYTKDGVRQVSIKRGAFALQMCELGIKGWRNYWQIDGAEVAFKDSTSIAVLPQQLMHELADAITERRSMSEEELTGLK